MNPRTPIRLMDPPANTQGSPPVSLYVALVLGLTFAGSFLYGFLLLAAMPY